MISNTLPDFTQNSVKRLIIKISGYIGRSCFVYISFLFENSLSPIELEILERIFTMGFYSDEVINAASSTALNEKITSVVDFNFLICEVNNSFCEVEEEE